MEMTKWNNNQGFTCNGDGTEDEIKDGNGEGAGMFDARVVWSEPLVAVDKIVIS